jgi:ribosome maturation factor RimP
VSSPGVDRPLTEPRHWRRARGRLVAVQAGDEALTGRVTDTSGAGVVLDVDGTARELAWPDLGPGRVQVEFNRRSDDTDAGED